MQRVAIIQARTGSTRLPSKVLRELSGRSMLAQVIRRAQAAEHVDRVCVATTTEKGDDPLVPEAHRCNADVVRGSESDVLGRYVLAAETLGLAADDLVLRITSDCPLLDPSVLDEMLARRERLVAESGPIDYYSNTLERRYPRGLDVEIVPVHVLQRVAAEATDPRAREHVTWHLYQHPETYRLVNHAPAAGADHGLHRWTVDTEADFELVRRIYGEFPADALFGLPEVLAVLAEHPEWTALNADVAQKKV